MLINSGTRTGQLMAMIFSHAGIGVDIFFAISGFLISTLLPHEKRRAKKIDLPRFYICRFFRILPAAMTYLAFVFILKEAQVIERPCITFGHRLAKAALAGVPRAEREGVI
jgi:peptidoglycan/LPS O-acetylase OafA/YrhL